MFKDRTIIEQKLDFCTKLNSEIYYETSREFLKYIDNLPMPYEEILSSGNLTRKCWQQVQKSKSTNENTLHVKNYAPLRLSSVTSLLFSESRTERRDSLDKYLSFKFCGNNLCCNPAHLLLLPSTMSREVRYLKKIQESDDITSYFYKLIDNHIEVMHLEDPHSSKLMSEDDLFNRVYTQLCTSIKDKAINDLIAEADLDVNPGTYNMLRKICLCMYPNILDLTFESRRHIVRELSLMISYVIKGENTEDE